MGRGWEGVGGGVQLVDPTIYFHFVGNIIERSRPMTKIVGMCGGVCAFVLIDITLISNSLSPILCRYSTLISTSIQALQGRYPHKNNFVQTFSVAKIQRNDDNDF